MFDHNSTVDLARGVQMTHLRDIHASEDALAHTIRVTVTRSGTGVDLSGADISATFVRADGVTVSITGTAEGSAAVVTLTAGCYAVPGRFVMAIKATEGEATTTLFVADGAITQTATDTVVTTPETALSLEQLFSRLYAAEASVSESASRAADAEESATAAAEVAQGAADATIAANAAADRANAAADRLEGVDVGTLTAEIDEVRAAVTPTLLWSGTGWSSGSIDVDGISDWHVVQIVTIRGNAMGFVAANVNAIGASMNTGQHSIIGVRFAVSGNTCTMVTAHVLKHNASSNHDAMETINVTAIYGLIKKGE